MSELLPVLDENKNMTPYYVGRDYAHMHGVCHPTVHIWVIKSNPIRILLQQRSFSKDSFPGQWDMSSAGHVTYGDTVKTAALRELQEELGVQTDIQHLTSIGSFAFRTVSTFHGNPWDDNEVANVYLYVAPEDFQPVVQKEEIEAVKWMTPNELMELQVSEEHLPVNERQLCMCSEDLAILYQCLPISDSSSTTE